MWLKAKRPAGSMKGWVSASPTVLRRDVPIYLEGIGQTRGNTETDILARVEGFITKVQFQEGTWVKKGQVLYTLDRRPLEATLAQGRLTKVRLIAHRPAADEFGGLSDFLARVRQDPSVARL